MTLAPTKREILSAAPVTRGVTLCSVRPESRYLGDLKDPWGHAFGYQYPGQNGSFDLIFYGQDGKPGGDGYSKDVGNWQ